MATALSPHMVLLAYWLVMIPIAAFFLRMACSLCHTDMPTWRRSIVSVLLVTFLAYLAFDFACYLILRCMDGISLRVPPWYGYSFWFREPIALKWFIISHAGIFRFLPFLIAVGAGGLLQFIVLEAQVSYGFGLLIVVMQWVATIVAGYIVSLLFGVVLSTIGWTPQMTSVAQAPERPPMKAQAKQEQPASLQMIEQNVQGAGKTPREHLENAGKNLKAYADSHLDELKEELAPLTEHLPEPARNFLDRGGWWAILAVIGFIALLWLRSILRKLGGKSRRPKKRKKRRKKAAPVKLKENLAWIGAGYTEGGPHRITVKGLPTRLRLILLSPANRDASGLSEEMADRVLDWIKPKMAEIMSYDQPGVRVWPPFYSADGFATTLASNVPIPEPKGMKSHWVLVAGQTKMGRVLIHVGLVLYADEANSLRLINVKGERWLNVLGVERAPQEAALS